MDKDQFSLLRYKIKIKNPFNNLIIEKILLKNLPKPYKYKHFKN